MKKVAWLMLPVLLAGSVMLQGCAARTEYSDKEEGDLYAKEQALTKKQYEDTSEDQVSVEEVKQESAEAFNKSAAFLDQEKNKIQRKMNVTIKELDAKIADLKQKSSNTSGEDQNKVTVQIKGLEEQRDKLKTMQTKLGTATKEAWADMRKNWENFEVEVNTNLHSDKKS